MIVKSIFSAIKDTFLRPLNLIPMLIVALASLTLGNLTSWALEKPLSDMILYPEVFMTSDLYVIAFNNYLPEMLVLFATGVVVTVLSVISMLTLARISKGDSLMEAINDSTSELTKSTALVVIITVASIILFAVLGAIASLTDINFNLAFILGAIYLILILIVLAKVAYTIPALVKAKNVKIAIQDSWEFTNDKFLSSFAFLVVIIIVIMLISALLGQVDLFTGEDFFLPIFIANQTISGTFLALALGHYYNQE
ncbi:MAG: hypothetical protein AABW59_01670 [archaeon]